MEQAICSRGIPEVGNVVACPRLESKATFQFQWLPWKIVVVVVRLALIIRDHLKSSAVMRGGHVCWNKYATSLAR